MEQVIASIPSDAEFGEHHDGGTLLDCCLGALDNLLGIIFSVSHLHLGTNGGETVEPVVLDAVCIHFFFPLLKINHR
jgi:hypothetical protein